MKKEEWINNIIENASKIEKVEVNPFLLSKIDCQINNSKAQLKPNYKLNLAFAFAISMVVVINVSSILFYKIKIQKQTESAFINSLYGELNFNSTYNYDNYEK